MKKSTKTTVTIIVEYDDESQFSFDVTITGNNNKILGELMMITRGTLMAANAEKATCYNEDGFDICSYTK